MPSTATHARFHPQLIARAQQTLASPAWRLNNLYTIEDKGGKVVPFRLNEQQADFYENMWYLNIILKARQLGFSTFIAMLFLDMCLFNSHTRCGIVDATLEDAKKKLGKIELAYEHLPGFLKRRRAVTASNATSIEFNNGSSIEVGTSHRGGTLQALHISELGKIAAHRPEKSREIRTGALNTIQAGMLGFIESTAEGQGGDFYDLCQVAEAKARMRSPLTPLDFKFHFYPWHKAPEYILPARSATISEPMERYFNRLAEKEAILLTPEQKAWYVKKRETQLEDMKREYPATPAEAFEASIQGAIFGDQIRILEELGRIGKFPAIPGVPVHMFFDIGRSDYTSIWFAQILYGPRLRIVGFYQNCMLELPHYAEYCFGTKIAKERFPDLIWENDRKGIFEQRRWKIGKAVFPHDIKVTEWGSGRSRIEQAIIAGFDAVEATVLGLHDGINATRSSLAFCEFDEAPTSEGLRMLRNYRWEWDDKLGVFRTGVPRHGIESHGSDALRTLGTTWRELPLSAPVNIKPAEKLDFAVGEDGSLKPNMDRAQLVEYLNRRQRNKSKRDGR